MFSHSSPLRPSQDDPPEAQPSGRGGCPVEGRSTIGQGRRDRVIIHLSAADLQQEGDHPADHPAEEGIGSDVDRHEPALPPDPDRVHGPDPR